MANWAHIQNNQIKELHDILPTSWGNVSGLINSQNDLPFLKTLGWLPVVRQYQDYNKDLYNPQGYLYQITDDSVIETLNLVEKDPELSFETMKQDFMRELRAVRDIKLKETDWTQLIDVQDLFSVEQKSRWASYRQKLRDLPSAYEQTQDTNPLLIIWPEY